MRKFFTVFCLALTTLSYAQKKIALLEPRAGEGSDSITAMEKAMVRGEMRKALVQMKGYEAFSRSDIDQMLEEHNFQRSGFVTQSEIHQLGEMSGADLLCVTTMTKFTTKFYLEAYIIDVESGAIYSPVSHYGEVIDGQFANLLMVCKWMAAELIGKQPARDYNTKALVASVFIPGLGQIMKKHDVEGSVTLVGEIALLGAGVGTYFGAKNKAKIMNSYNIDYNTYQSAANSKKVLQSVSYSFFGLAAVLYGVNLWRAYTIKPATRQYAFYPTIIPTNDRDFAFGLGATIKF